mmetsp:Transcript_19608/g.34675  ORF Transcript_19608/g.34675 Transcript_19608/m.34675 type:complete len:601 (-) Transcript_19608:64-1866(-)
MTVDWNPFIDPSGLSFPQLAFLCVVYAYTLFQASNLISDGSELLIFIPELEGIIGSVILPVLGVVPDSMMVLCSGLGSRSKVAHQVTVGVGTLAGSTIMLLTLPWSISIFAGRVSILKDGTATYRRPAGQRLMPPGSVSLTQTGIRCGTELKVNAILMLLTMTAYAFPQLPAEEYDRSSLSYDQQGRHENFWLLVGFVYSGCWFLIYLAQQFWESRKEDSHSIGRDIEINNIVDLIHEGKFTLADTMAQFRRDAEDETGHRISLLIKAQGAATVPEHKEALLSPVHPLPKRAIIRMKQVLKHFFVKYDKDHDGTISQAEFYLVCKDLGLQESVDIQDQLFKDADLDCNGTISLEEFQGCIMDCARNKVGPAAGGVQPKLPNSRSMSEINTLMNGIDEEDSRLSGMGGKDDDESAENDGEDDEEDEPEDLKDLDPAMKKRWILIRSFRQMFFGTCMVLAFSSPMVDVLSALGDRLQASPYYISFVVAPIASNAGELVAAYNYAVKKTERSITVSISTLQGAACMNNTLCLCIFLGLMYFRDLPWKFTAECYSIIIVQVIMIIYSYTRRTQTLLDALLITSLYPLSLLFVFVLKDPEGPGLD